MPSEDDVTAWSHPGGSRPGSISSWSPISARVGLHPGYQSRHDNEHSASGNAVTGVKQRAPSAVRGHADTLSNGRAAWGAWDS